MSKISDKLNIIEDAKNDIKTAIENKGVTVGDIGIQEYASKIDEMEVATPPTKGIIINECDSDGYPTDVSIVGMTSIPDYYLYSYGKSYQNYLTKKLVNVNLPNDLISIGANAFSNTNLSSIKLPNGLTTIGSNAFGSNSNLVLNELPSSVTKIDSYAFGTCPKITIKEIPSGVTVIYSSVLQYCDGITEMTVLGNITSIGTYAFYKDINLTKLVLPNITSVPTLSNKNAFSSTPIASGTGYIYVPDALVDSFKTASNWSTYASQIKGISEM